MKKPDIPENEAERLNDLRSLNVLDTPAEERFDRLTRMAKRMFDVPFALVSLVDENRQWFKSCIGLDASETSRDISFCGHAILGDDIFLIPDASKDERFMDNPLVTGDPHIRFYAGCPLRLATDSKVGTLCIIDKVSRELSEDDLELLRDLASLVENEFNAVQMATVDELTGLSNRRGFMMLGQKAISFCKRNSIPASLAFLDLNKFKPINDNFGHEEGDRALKEFSSLILDNLRESDIPARLGGDEFAILFLNTTSQGAHNSIDKLQKILDKLNQQSNKGYDICFAHGIVEYNPEKHLNIESLLSEGDALMYECKKKDDSAR